MKQYEMKTFFKILFNQTREKFSVKDSKLNISHNLKGV